MKLGKEVEILKEINKILGAEEYNNCQKIQLSRQKR